MITGGMCNYTGHSVVFIVGCPRSGTTWLQRLLASHPKIHSGEESHVFSMYVGPQLRAWKSQLNSGSASGGSHLVGPPAYFDEREFLEILKTYTLNLFKPVLDALQPDELFLEKTPSHALFIPEIKELLPEARIIHILRDPRDVVASLLAAARTWGSNWAPRGAGAAAEIWVQHVNAVRQAAKSLSSNEFYQVHYEGLWNSPLETLEGVANFLGIAWGEDAVVKAIEANLPQAMESGGTPIPVYGEVATRTGAVAKLPEGFVRKARPGAWKTDLSLREKFRVLRVACKLMQEVGYQWPLREWFDVLGSGIGRQYGIKNLLA